MKRIGFIWDKVCDIENIKRAIWEASDGKRDRPNVKRVLGNRNRYAKIVQRILVDKAYEPSPYIIETIIDGLSGKERSLYKPIFFPDQIIHWAVMLVVRDVFMRGMYKYNCGCIKGRGPIAAKRYTEKAIRNDPKGTKYCFKADIHHFYGSVDHGLLKKCVRRLIKDPNVLWLLDKIIDSVPDEDGLPLGNYTSGWFGNLFLTQLDHYIKEALHVKYYVRYIDDIVLFGPNLRKLHKIREAIEAFLCGIKLELNKKSDVFRVQYFNKKLGKMVGRCVDFVGYIIGRVKTRIRKRIALRIIRTFRKLSKGLYTVTYCKRFMSYLGYIKNSDSFALYHKYVKGHISIKRIRRVIRDANRETYILARQTAGVAC